jgi:hypothetical protein
MTVRYGAVIDLSMIAGSVEEATDAAVAVTQLINATLAAKSPFVEGVDAVIVASDVLAVESR